jgi:hypothetical protein
MKKLLLVCVTVAASLLMSSNTQAQQQPTKIGYFDEQELLSLFPGLGDTLEVLMESYVKDSLNVEYAYTFQDYKRRDSLFKIDSAGMPAKARELALTELNRLAIKLTNWQQYSSDKQKEKMDRILYPYRVRMVTTLQQIVAEGKYTMVLNKDVLSPYVQPPLLDDLTIRVALKLGLEIGPELTEAWKKAGGTVPAAPKATTTAPKTNTPAKTGGN